MGMELTVFSLRGHMPGQGSLYLGDRRGAVDTLNHLRSSDAHNLQTASTTTESPLKEFPVSKIRNATSKTNSLG